MDMDAAVNADNEECFQVEETDDSCTVDYIEIVPIARDTDGSYTAECVSGDCIGEVREVDMADLEQEAVNADNEECFQVEETDDSCRVDYIEIVPIARDTDGSYTAECVSGDCIGEVREVDMADLKQEPHDVCCVYIFYHSGKSLFR